MPDDQEDAFGFGAVSSARERIKQIKPSAPTSEPLDLDKIDAIAETAGFVSREAPQEVDYTFRTQKYQQPEPRMPLNMRVPISVGTAFQRFCEQERYSYPEGLTEVMRRAGLPFK